jgi:hypothetical protein
MLNKKLQKIVAAGLVAGFLTCSTGLPVAAAAGPQPGGQPPRQEQQVNNQQKRPAPQQSRGPQNSSANSSWNRGKNRPEQNRPGSSWNRGPQQNRPEQNRSGSSWNRDRQNRPEYRPAPRENNRRYDPPRRDRDSHSDTGNLVTGILIGGVIGAIIANNT